MKEELIDDIIEESQPYKRPESVRKRTVQSHQITKLQV